MGSTSAAALRKVLETHAASEIAIAKEAVIEIDSKMSPIEAASILMENNILGAPVWDEVEKKYIGFFDMRDVIKTVVAAIQIDCGGEFSDKMAKEMDEGIKLTDLASRHQFVSCEPDETLMQLCEKLVGKHCHRVPIIDSSLSKKCHSLVSQSALIKFLSENTTKDDLHETLDEAKLPYRKEVVSVFETLPAFEAFALLDSNRISGLAVVDEDGELVGNTSARDIKYACLDCGRHDMGADIFSYLAAIRRLENKKARYPSCSVHQDATVAHVVNMMAKTGYHRIFVVDEEKKPVGIISVSDLVSFVIEQ